MKLIINYIRFYRFILTARSSPRPDRKGSDKDDWLGRVFPLDCIPSIHVGKTDLGGQPALDSKGRKDLYQSGPLEAGTVIMPGEHPSISVRRGTKRVSEGSWAGIILLYHLIEVN